MTARPFVRVWLVTGASSGIGRATALAAASQGAHVVLVARARGPLEEAARDCTAAGAASTLVVPADVGDDVSVRDAVAEALTHHARLDVVVSSAGVVAYGRTEDVPPDVFEGVLRTNLSGSINVARHVVPVLRAQGDGVLVLMGSVIGHVAIPTMSPYMVSKWGVRALARQLRIENRDVPGVRIRYVSPGGVDTPIYRQAANVVGVPGRPPPPGSSALRAGRQVARRVDSAWLPDQLSLLNYPLVAGFATLPKVYDACIGAVFPLGATDLGRAAEVGPGNVLASRPLENGLDGRHGNPWLGLAKNLAIRVRRGITRPGEKTKPPDGHRMDIRRSRRGHEHLYRHS